MSSRVLSAGYSMLCVVALCAFGAHAATESTGRVEEILVTATKRVASVEDVPIAVTAITGDELQDREIRTFKDLNSAVPNVFVGERSGVSFITIRGISSAGSLGLSESAVGIYIDGVYQPRPGSLPGVFNDLERLEVVRGPQGTLYGRNATGGSINLTTNGPTDSFSGSVGLMGGSYDHYRVRGFVSGPLTDNLLFRVSSFYEDRNAYTENLQPGVQDIDPEKAYGYRGVLQYRPADDVVLDLRVARQIRETGSMLQSYTPPQPIFFPIYQDVPYSLKPRKQFSDIQNKQDSKDTLVVLAAEWTVSDALTLRSTTGYINNHYSVDFDGDGTGRPASDVLPTFTDANTWSEEVTAHLDLMDGRLDMLVGANYYNDQAKFGFDLPLGFLASLLQNTENPVPPFPMIILRSDQKTTAEAMFVDATYSFTDKLRLGLGVRSTWEQKDDEIQNFIVAAPACGFGTPPSKLDRNWDDISPKVSVQYDVSDSAMTYIQWQKGYKAGGFNESSCNDPYNSETLYATEIGIKTELFDRSVRLHADAFYYDYSNLQVSNVRATNVDISNAGVAEIYGVELESWFVASDALELNLALTWTNSQYGDVTDCDGLLFPGNCLNPATRVLENLRGNPLNRTPEYTVGAGVTYTIRGLGSADVALRAEYFWSDELSLRQFNRGIDKQDSYSLVNLYVDVSFGDSPLTLKAFGRNVTDEDVLASVVDVATNSFNRLAQWQPPRTWGIEAVYTF